MRKIKSNGSALVDVVSCASSALISAEQAENAFYILLSRQIPRKRIRRSVHWGQRRAAGGNSPQDQNFGGHFGQSPKGVGPGVRVSGFYYNVPAYPKPEGVQGAVAAKISFHILFLRLSRPVFFLIFLLI